LSQITKTILCYGDSNTWGNKPRSDERYPRGVRWPSALQSLLGEEYEVISEGLCGRTLVAVDPTKPHRTGITHLRAILESADPIDLVIVMLGRNDVKSTYNLGAEDIAGHLEQTICFIQSGPSDLERIPKILVVCPPQVVQPAKSAISAAGADLDARMVRGIDIFKKLPVLYEAVAKKTGCGFINAEDHITSSQIDGYHLDAESHLKLAEVIKEWISTYI
jgi:lysophospholipase L1-like esterase